MFVSYSRAAGLLSPRTLTLIQPGDIVCSALTVHYHKNGNKELWVNAMLDPSSTSSYISEDAAEELVLASH